MKIRITDYTKLKDIPSGSGLAVHEEKYYIVGDDSPYLFVLDKEFKLLSKTKLIEAKIKGEGRIDKAIKPDFEALEIINHKEILIFGSGSLSPQRDVFLHLSLEADLQLRYYLLTEFYESIKSLAVMRNSELNLEAVAYHNNSLFLFNRSNNLLLKYDYPQWLSYIQGKAELPEPEVKQYQLPSINGIEAKFSGATSTQDGANILFTASVEDTSNAYEDGEILGSFVGLLDSTNNKLGELRGVCRVEDLEKPLKIESVSFIKEISDTQAKIAMLTDDDLGNSILIEALLHYH